MYTDPGGEFFITASMVVSWIISTGIFAINGGISAHLMGQSFWRGFAAGAVVGAVVGGVFGLIGKVAGIAVANNPWFIMGSRIAGTAGYGLVNEFFQYGTLANMNWGLYAVDIMMDFGFGLYYIGPISSMSDIGRALLQGVIEMGIDALQTYLFYSPKAQARIRRHRLTEAERYMSGRRYEDKSRFYMNKLCVST